MRECCFGGSVAVAVGAGLNCVDLDVLLGWGAVGRGDLPSRGVPLPWPWGRRCHRHPLIKGAPSGEVVRDRDSWNSCGGEWEVS